MLSTPSFETLCEDVYILPHFWDIETCDAMLEQIQEMTFEEAPIGRNQRMSKMRNNDRVLWDDETTTQRLWERLRDYPLPSVLGLSPLGLNERLRIYRYTKGQHFAWHADGRFRRDNGEQSFYTFLLYLTGDLRGGETQFRGAKIAPQPGLACLFAHKKEHKGAEVLEGMKIVLRSDLMYPPFPTKKGTSVPQ